MPDVWYHEDEKGKTQVFLPGFTDFLGHYLVHGASRLLAGAGLGALLETGFEAYTGDPNITDVPWLGIGIGALVGATVLKVEYETRDMTTVFSNAGVQTGYMPWQYITPRPFDKGLENI